MNTRRTLAALAVIALLTLTLGAIVGCSSKSPEGSWYRVGDNFLARPPIKRYSVIEYSLEPEGKLITYSFNVDDTESEERPADAKLTGIGEWEIDKDGDVTMIWTMQDEKAQLRYQQERLFSVRTDPDGETSLINTWGFFHHTDGTTEMAGEKLIFPPLYPSLKTAFENAR